MEFRLNSAALAACERDPGFFAARTTSASPVRIVSLEAGDEGAGFDAASLAALLRAGTLAGAQAVNARFASPAAAGRSSWAGVLTPIRLDAERRGLRLLLEMPAGGEPGATTLADQLDAAGSWVFGAGLDLSAGVAEPVVAAAVETLRQRLRLVRVGPTCFAEAGAMAPWLSAVLERVDFDGFLVCEDRASLPSSHGS